MNRPLKLGKLAALLLLILQASTSAAQASDCAQAYLLQGQRIREARSFGDLPRSMLDYEKTLRFFDQNQAKAAITWGVTLLGAPLLLLVDGIDSLQAAAKARRLIELGEALHEPRSRAATPGLARLYNLIRDDVEISEDDFLGFLDKVVDPEGLCRRGPQIFFSEKGLQRIGDEGFLAFAHRTAGTPEWKEFHNDPDNFRIAWGSEPLEDDTLKQALIAQLIAQSYPRR